jgi:type IV secretory pathway VirB10-like protein
MRSFIMLSLSALFLVACGGDKPEPKTAESTVTATKVEPTPTSTPTTADAPPEPKKEEPPPPKKKKTAKEILESGSTYMFSLADSPDAKKAADDKCDKTAKKDEKKLEACKKDAETAAAGEGIRFEKDDKGDWSWVSFGKEKDKEAIYNKVKFKVAGETEGKVTLTPEGKDTGKKPMKTLPKEMVLEVPDESTVVMSDPAKGKLVFKKK